MKQVILDVKDENIDTVLTILSSLKTGLIDNIECDVKVKHTKYKPKSQTVKESERPSGKYVNPAEYKNRIRKK